jgi:DNA repair exonuclease SbcCD ATPase subunit
MSKPVANYLEINDSAQPQPPGQLPLPGVPEGGAEIAVLEREVEALRSRSAALAAQNAELERKLSGAAAEAESLRAADSGECAVLRQRIQTLSEHLDTADRHVASMRSRLDQQSAEATRRITRLEAGLREREVDFVAESKRLNSALGTETTKRQKRIEELEEANERLATEAKGARSAAARERHSLESRVSSLLSDIAELKKRDAEAIGDRDRTIIALRQDIENIKSVAAAEKAQFRQSLSDAETLRQRDALQHAKIVDGLKATIGGLERDTQSVRETAAAEHRRFEAALADERERARRQLDARDEQRRKIEARAEAAEKQAAGATATATMEIVRANQLEARLNAERTARSEEIEALQQHSAAVAAQLEANQNASNLIVDELRVRLAEFAGEDAASAAVASARERRDSLLSEVATLRARLAEAEAVRPIAGTESHDDDTETAGEAIENGAHARIAEVMAYAESLESELAELRAQAEAPPEPTPILKPTKVVMPTAPTPSWRKHLVAGIARHSRRG